MGLFPKLAHHAFPFVGHELVAAIGRMHVVPDPVVGRGALGRLVEDALEMHERRAVLLREPGDDLLPLADALVDRAAAWSRCS